MTAKITSPQTKQIERFLVDALGAANLNKDGAQRIIKRGDELKSRVAKLLTELSIDTGETASQRAARKIMGKNFLGIPEVTEHFGSINPAALLALQNVPFDAATLKARAKTHILVADVGLSLVNVRSKVERALLYSHENSWYSGEEFAICTEQARWRLIRKTLVSNSTSKNWSEQQTLIDDNIDEISTARQVVYMTILNYLATGERLFENVYVRTCDVDSDGHRVYVGDFDGYGLNVCDCDGDNRYSHVGVSSARKF